MLWQVPRVPKARPSEAQRAGLSCRGPSPSLLASRGRPSGFPLELGLPKAFVPSGLYCDTRHTPYLRKSCVNCASQTVGLDLRLKRRSWNWNCEVLKLKVMLIKNSRESTGDSVRQKTEVQGCTQWLGLRCGFVSLGETEDVFSLSSPWHPARESSTAQGGVLTAASR